MVAIWSQTAAARREPAIPMARMVGPSGPNVPVTAKSSGSRIPFRIVSVTCPPTSTAPANSKIPATMMAPPRVRAPEPTDVPMALATSFAPMFHAM